MRFIDWGTLDKVKLTDIRCLHEHFLKTPILAVCCELSDIKPINIVFTRPNALHFIDIVEGKKLNARIKKLNQQVSMHLNIACRPIK